MKDMLRRYAETIRQNKVLVGYLIVALCLLVADLCGVIPDGFLPETVETIVALIMLPAVVILTAGVIVAIISAIGFIATAIARFRRGRD